MFYFRINKVKILNNRELLGKAEVSFLSFITVEETDFPKIDDLLAITDEKERKRLIEEAVTKVTGSVQIPKIAKIRDKQNVTFGDTGVTVFRSKTVPNDFNWLFLAVESDSKTRNNAAAIQAFFTKEKVDTIVSKVLGLLTLSNPAAAAVNALAPIVFDGICEALKNDKDDQIGVSISSFIRSMHYPNGKRDAQDVSDATGNMFVDYTIFTE